MGAARRREWAAASGAGPDRPALTRELGNPHGARETPAGPRWLRTLVGVGLAALTACSSSNELENFPQVDVSIDAVPGKSLHEFAADTTGGQLQSEATVRIRNSGNATLKVTAVDFVSQNKFLKEIWPNGKPEFPKSLEPNDFLTVKVRFTPDPNEEDNNGAVMTIKHDDKKYGADVVLQFKIKTSGAHAVFTPKSLTFINPSKSSPKTECVQIGNDGNAPLIFKGAAIGTASPYYSVVETPNEGDTIPALGEGNNQKANPMYLKVCVRVLPEGQDKDYSGKLVITTSDAAAGSVVIPMAVQWKLDNKYTVTCSAPDGGIKFDFLGVSAGVAERCCSIANDNPATGSGMAINKFTVEALDESKKELVASLYSTSIESKNAAGDPIKVEAGKFAINPGKSAKFCVTYTYPQDGKTANGEAVVRFTIAQLPDAVQIPVFAGTCDTPDLVLAPGASPLWMDAAVGSKTTRTLVVANQSCAPMQILQACASQVAASGTNPCGKADALSQHFFVDPEVGLSSVDAWGLKPLTVRFEPPNNKYVDVQHYLHIVYCPGAWDGSKCSEAPVTVTTNLLGYVGADRKLPELSLAVATPGDLKVGQPIKIEASALDGAWPIGEYGAYVWFIAKRPAGSGAWLSNEFQSTDTSWINLKVDAPGDYTVMGAVQAVNPQNPGQFAWSIQAKVDFSVAK